MRHPSTKALSVLEGTKMVKKYVAINCPVKRHGNIAALLYESKIVIHVIFRPFITAKQ